MQRIFYEVSRFMSLLQAESPLYKLSRMVYTKYYLNF